MNNIVYLEFNNWFGGRDYPEIPNIEEWVGGCESGSPLYNDEWCKNQKICVLYGPIDMSANFCITATREWVEQNCPKCLTDETYTVDFHWQQGEKEGIKTETYSFKQFRHEPKDGEECVYGNFGWRFLDYEEENFGCQYHDDDNDISDYDDDEDE